LNQAGPYMEYGRVVRFTMLNSLTGSRPNESFYECSWAYICHW